MKLLPVLMLSASMMAQVPKQEKPPTKTVWPQVTAVSVTVNEGDDSGQLTVGTQRIVALSTSEQARLQKLRQAVADAEKEIAKAHGVDTDGNFTRCVIAAEGCLGWDGNGHPPKPPDAYEFRGQFLLINVPDSKGAPK